MKWNVKVNDKVKWNPDNPVIDEPQKCGRIKRFFKINKEWLSLICYGQNKWPCIIMMWPFKQGGCKVGFHCTVLEYHWVKIVFTCFFSFVFQFFGSFSYFLLFWRAWPSLILISALWPANCGAAAMIYLFKARCTLHYNVNM